MLYVLAFVACLALALAFFGTRAATRENAFVNHARQHGVPDIRARLAEKGVSLPKPVPAIVLGVSLLSGIALWVPVALVVWLATRH